MSEARCAVHALYRSDSPNPAFLDEARTLFKPEIIEVDRVEPPWGYVRWLQTIDWRLKRLSSRLPQRQKHLDLVADRRSRVSDALVLDLRRLPPIQDIPDSPDQEGALYGAARRQATALIDSIRGAIETISQRADFDPEVFLAVLIPTWRNPLSLGV